MSHDLSNLPPDLAAILERARDAVGELARKLNEHCLIEPQVGFLLLVEANGQLAVLDHEVDSVITPQLNEIAETLRDVNSEVHGEPTGSIKVDIAQGLN